MKHTNKYHIILFLCWINSLSFAQRINFSGWVKDIETNENVIGALVGETISFHSDITNDHGYFSLIDIACNDSLAIYIRATGYEELIISPQCRSTDTVLYLQKQKVRELKEVDVKLSINNNVHLGTISVGVEDLRKIPAIGGEPDIIRALQLFPGIQGGKEGTSGLYVRGGTPDQNLFLLDNVPLYNVNHIGGFLSVFDPNAINHVQLYKGNFPAKYSGRLSSVVDIRLRNGNKSNNSSDFQLGLLSTKFQTEGPLGKDSSWTFIISIRRFNIDLITRLLSSLDSGGESVAGYTFFDSNFKLVKQYKNKSSLCFGYYGGRDRIFVKSKKNNSSDYRYNSNVKWGNFMGFVQYNKPLGQKWFYTTTLAFTHFFYSTDVQTTESESTISSETKNNFRSDITDFLLKQTIQYKPINRWNISAGWNITKHKYLPGKMRLKNGYQDTTIDLSTRQNL